MGNVTKEMLKAVEDYNMGAFGEGSAIADTKLVESIIELHEVSKPKPKAMPCEIVSSDFSENIVTLKMKDDHYSVNAGMYWLCVMVQPIRHSANKRMIRLVKLRKKSINNIKNIGRLDN